MKKTAILYLFCLLSFTVYSQVRIVGTVYDEKNQPLEGASVYINNTSIGSTTDDEGFFSLRVSPGEYQLIVSFIGYHTQVYPLNTRIDTTSLRFVLKVKNNVLNEVVLKDVKPLSRAKRNAYLRKFQRAFLGESEFGRNAKVLNKEVLDYQVSSYDDTFEVTASEPIKISNPKLGYIIHYDLVHFELTPVSVTYFGYTRFETFESMGLKSKKWKKNRLKAYKGSIMHFLRSVRLEQVKDQGFIVDHIKRVPNPFRPSNQEITEAMEYLRKNDGLQSNPYTNTSAINNKIAEAQRVLERAKLPEFIDEVLQKNIGLMLYGIVHDMEIYLQFAHSLRVTYLDETPDKRYNSTESSSVYQASMISLYQKNVKVLEHGVFEKPYDVFTRGYWAFEKVGDLVPLNYVPHIKTRVNIKSD